MQGFQPRAASGHQCPALLQISGHGPWSTPGYDPGSMGLLAVEDGRQVDPSTVPWLCLLSTPGPGTSGPPTHWATTATLPVCPCLANPARCAFIPGKFRLGPLSMYPPAKMGLTRFRSPALNKVWATKKALSPLCLIRLLSVARGNPGTQRFTQDLPWAPCLTALRSVRTLPNQAYAITTRPVPHHASVIRKVHACRWPCALPTNLFSCRLQPARSIARRRRMIPVSRSHVTLNMIPKGLGFRGM